MLRNVESKIRSASKQDIPAIERVVYDAYKSYIPRIGKPPAPMTDDYRLHVAAGNAWVLVLDNQIIGLVVLVPKAGYMLLDNVAVAPTKQGAGWGRRLIEFAETRTRECGYAQIRLYTNELMHENLALYERLGYREFSRRLDSGFKRVFMKKTL